MIYGNVYNENDFDFIINPKSNTLGVGCSQRVTEEQKEMISELLIATEYLLPIGLNFCT